MICQWIYIVMEETTADTGRTCKLSTVSRLCKTGFKPIVKNIVFQSEVKWWNGRQGNHHPHLWCLILFLTPLCTQCLVQDLEQCMLPFITAEGVYKQICVCRLLCFYYWQLQIARVTSLLPYRECNAILPRFAHRSLHCCWLLHAFWHFIKAYRPENGMSAQTQAAIVFRTCVFVYMWTIKSN